MPDLEISLQFEFVSVTPRVPAVHEAKFETVAVAHEDVRRNRPTHNSIQETTLFRCRGSSSDRVIVSIAHTELHSLHTRVILPDDLAEQYWSESRDIDVQAPTYLPVEIIDVSTLSYC